MLKKIKLGSSLAALILFAFPWLDLQCSEKSLATQSGLQVIYGGGSPSEELEAMGDHNARSEAANSSESMGLAPLVGLAFIAVIGAVAFSTLSLFRGSERADLFASILPAAALLLLLAQLMTGFPAKKKILEEMSENSSQISSQISSEIHSRDDEFAKLEKQWGRPWAQP